VKQSPAVSLSQKLIGGEEALGAFFKEMLYVYNLGERSASVLNEMEVIETTGDFFWKHLHPSFLAVFLPAGTKTGLVPVYENARTATFRRLAGSADIRKTADAALKKGSIRMRRIVIRRRTLSLAAIPLRAGKEKFGVLVFAAQKLPEARIAAAAGCCAVTSVSLHTLRFYQEILKNERLVAVGQTISGLSHDIRNILVGLGGGLDLLETGTKNRNWDTTEEALNLSRRGHERLTNLVLDMLDFSKTRVPVYETRDLNVFVGDIAADIAETLKNNVTIATETDPALPPVALDYPKIDRIITNLLNNAVESFAADAADNTPEKKKKIVTVTTRFIPESKTAEIRIADNGCGIPKKDLDKIFEIFYSTKGTRGTGLGLALAKKIVEDHRGTMAVSSVIGKGTTFTLSLPVSSKQG